MSQLLNRVLGEICWKAAVGLSTDFKTVWLVLIQISHGMANIKDFSEFLS